MPLCNCPDCRLTQTPAPPWFVRAEHMPSQFEQPESLIGKIVQVSGRMCRVDEYLLAPNGFRVSWNLT